jgi:threonine synthase
VRYDAFVQKLKASLTRSPGALSPDVRGAIVERNTQKIPPALAPYVIKVALHAYKVTDEDILQLKRDGLSEDVIFEATAAAAVSAALLRLEKGMAALRTA